MGLTEVAISQDFDNIERRLGGIVAEGDLSLEQATVMLHALREHAQHQRAQHAGTQHAGQANQHHEAELRHNFERLGIEPEALMRVRRAMNERGIQGPVQQQAMQVVLRMSQMMKSSDKKFEMPEVMLRHLRDGLRLNEEQAAWLAETSNRLTRASNPKSNDSDQKATEERIVQWIESVESKLKASVESGDLSEENAWKKWLWYKENEISPKIKAAINSGDLSDDQGKHIWAEISEREDAEHRKE